MTTSILRVYAGNEGARARAGLFLVASIMFGGNAVGLVLLSRYVELPAYSIPALGVAAGIFLLAGIVSLRRIRAAFEIFEENGTLGARLLSRSGAELARVVAPFTIARGFARIGRPGSLVLCFADGDRSPIVLRCNVAYCPPEWREQWGRLPETASRTIRARYRCFKLADVVRVLEERGAA